MKKLFQVTTMFFILGLVVLGGANQSKAADPYIFGYQTDLTGSARASYAPIAEGFRLYIERLNEGGGVNGHPIKVIYEDDKSEPGLANGVAEKFITKDNVMAILGLGFSGSQPPVLELAGKSGVPVITGYTATAPLFPPNPTKHVFSIGVQMHPKAHPQAYSAAYIGSKLHPGKSIAVTSFDTPGSRISNDWCEGWAKKFGMKVVYKDGWPAKTQDFAPWLAGIAEAKPDFLSSMIGGMTFIPFVKQMEKYGLEKVDYLVCDFVTEEDLIKGIKQLTIGNGENVLWLSRYASTLDPQRPPEFENIAKAMKKYGHQYQLSSLHCMGWTLARTVESALKKAGWPCTRSNFIDALEKVEVDTKGLTGGSIKFVPKDHYGPSYWKAYRWDAKLKGLRTAVDWYRINLEDIVGKM